MEIKKEDKFYRIKWFWNIISHGLFMHGLRNRFASIGIDFMPYYFVQEGVTAFNPPEIRGKSTDYQISYFGEAELKLIKKSIIGIEGKDLLKDFKNGQLCIGLKHQDEIAAYMFVKQDEFHFRGRTFTFQKNEAYLHSMYTFETYRGKNIAPYLRFKSYELIKEQGIDTIFSVSEYFNKSTIRFKSKLGSKHLKLFLSVVLFKKVQRNYTLKNCLK